MINNYEPVIGQRDGYSAMPHQTRLQPALKPARIRPGATDSEDGASKIRGGSHLHHKFFKIFYHYFQHCYYIDSFFIPFYTIRLNRERENKLHYISTDYPFKLCRFYVSVLLDLF
jgi:hypothetical protein